jgi:hypothetical protein
MTKSSGVPRYSAWRVFQQDISSVSGWFQGILASLVDWLFEFNQRGVQRRFFLFLLTTLLLWFGLAYLSHPISAGPEPLMVQLFSALFSTNVLRHFLILILGLWIALRLAALYLDDIFELRDVRASQRFIWLASFPGHYYNLTIKNGGVAPEHRRSHIVHIGGPGLVDVHMENVALFEKIDGRPHVIEPTFSRQSELEGFERLRAVIDLRDQMIELRQVDSRTRDGIPVQARDVRLIYSIYRGNQRIAGWDGYPQPYPFNPEAVTNLVYKHGPDPWEQVMKNMIQSELRDFIARHNLSEFLASAETAPDDDSFVHRDKVTNLFYDFAHGFTRRAEERGVQLDWIGVGTWVTPSEIIPARHLEAWRLSSETRWLTSLPHLEKVREESRQAELLRLIEEVQSSYLNLLEEDAGDRVMIRRLLLYYREKLHNAIELYKNQGQPVPPEVEEAFRTLTIILAHRPQPRRGRTARTRRGDYVAREGGVQAEPERQVAEDSQADAEDAQVTQSATTRFGQKDNDDEDIADESS